MGLTYSKAGVDIDRGDNFARKIGALPSLAVSRDIGGFAGGIEIDTQRYKKPLLLTTTDGVGTKLLVARELGDYSTLGIDLVAMSVNDLIVCGAEPMLFLDYIACGRIEESILMPLVEGIVKGCEEAGCTRAGGETAEMPDLYKEQDFDLAGFCVGIVEKEELLPKKENMKEGDLILGLPSTGVHSNGLSLARKAIPVKERTLLKELLIPTKIYVKSLTPFLKEGLIKGCAHITGGGLAGNFSRIIPKNLKPAFSHSWSVPEIFREIQNRGKIDSEEMNRVFNMGVGIAFVVEEKDAARVFNLAKQIGTEVMELGVLCYG